jgi:hypothetical protein
MILKGNIAYQTCVDMTVASKRSYVVRIDMKWLDTGEIPHGESYIAREGWKDVDGKGRAI